MKKQSCPVCNELSSQCLSCASYVVDGEHIYYNEIKDFGATKEHELQFIKHIHKHSVTAFFNKGKLYIPSRQGRSVPLAIGLQWDVWQIQQAKIDELKTQLNNMEQCYIGMKKINDEQSEIIRGHVVAREELKKQVDAVEHVLGCAMIGPKEVFAYARRIQEALRGES